MNKELFKSYREIAALIAQDIAGTISEADEQQLRLWISKDAANRQIYERIKLRIADKQSIDDIQHLGVAKDWKAVRSRIQGHERRYVRMLRYVSIAAVVALVVSASFLFMNESLQKPSRLGDPICPGSPKATVTLATGEHIYLEEQTDEWLQTDSIIASLNLGSSILAQSLEQPDSIEYYNTIKIPRGGEFRFVLPDGTRVSLNSDSELSYPVKFKRQSRNVYIKGEAFFDVKTDNEKPFVVHITDDMFIRVLGTSFNVSAYEDDSSVVTTLISGKVEAVAGDESLVVHPNQQVVYDKSSERMLKTSVNATNFTAWSDGKFVFQNQNLEQIMKIVSRWYDVNVIFRDDHVKKFMFSGDLERYDELATSLRMLEKVTRINVEVSDKNVYIGSR